MTGIAGLIRFDGGPIEPERAATLLDAIRFGGADTHDVWNEAGVALAASLRWTTPEAVGSQQPLRDRELILVFDGWLADPEAVARDLAACGEPPRARDDAAHVLAAYRAWGEDCVDRLDGEFAFCVWDDGRRRAFCARDRMGVRTFYYAADARQLLFSTDVAPILAAAGRAFALNLGAVADYLAGEQRSDVETLWQGVLRLPAATRMIVSGDVVKLERYWRPEEVAPLKLNGERDLVAAYRDVLFASVRQACRASAPVACEVSGGLDSSGVYCVAHALAERGALPAPGLRGYTLNFETDAAADEISFARSVGRHCRTTIAEFSPLAAGPDRVWTTPVGCATFPAIPRCSWASRCTARWPATAAAWSSPASAATSGWPAAATTTPRRSTACGSARSWRG